MGPSFLHLLIVVLILLLLFGPNKIPLLGRSIGKAIRNFKKELSGDQEIDVTYSVISPSSTELPEEPHLTESQVSSSHQPVSPKNSSESPSVTRAPSSDSRKSTAD